MQMRQIEAVGEQRLIRQIRIKWKNSDWEWIDDTDYLAYRNQLDSVDTTDATTTAASSAKNANVVKPLTKVHKKVNKNGSKKSKNKKGTSSTASPVSQGGDSDAQNDGSSDPPGMFEVENILGGIRSGKKIHYLVKWKGYDNPADNTWEESQELKDLSRLSLLLTAILLPKNRRFLRTKANSTRKP